MKKNRLVTSMASKLNIFIVIVFMIMVLLCLFFPTVPQLITIGEDTSITDSSEEWFYQLDINRVQNISTYALEAKPEAHKTYHISSRLPEHLTHDYGIMFTSKNCLVTVTSNNLILYKTKTPTDMDSIPYLGKNVHIVSVPATLVGQEINICYKPVTNHDIALIDTIYSGNETTLRNTYVRKNLVPLTISCLIIVLGILHFLVGLLDSKRRTGQSMLYFGLFSICYGIFAITHLNILPLFFPCSVFLYELEFLTVALLPYPALCYVMVSQSILPTLRHNIIKGIPLISFIFVIIVHYTRIMPLNQSRPLTLVMILYFAVIICYYFIKKILQSHTENGKKSTWSDYVNLAFLIACITEFVLFHMHVIDSFLVVSHYLLTFILLIRLASFGKEARKLLEIGINAQHLEDCAFFDSLTGLRNRTSLNQDIEELEHTLTANSSIAIIQLDVNYLKRTNDIMGHLAGDRLLKNAATAIRTGFADYGRCYRFGGDEFVVILQNNPKEKYNLGISAMENACEKMNKTLAPMEHVSIAYGIAYYSSESDTSLWRVQERADVVMYERKRKMKEKHVSNSSYKDDRL